MSYRDGWQTISWGDVATLEYGKSLRDYKDRTDGVPVYGTNGKIGYTDESLCDFPSVIVGRKGAYRGVHYSSKPFFVIDTAFYLKPRIESLDLKFAYYHLLTKDINSMDSGSAIPSTSREDFYGLELDLPPLPTQRRIAAILSAFDDKIELNREMNRTLEEMARALFREMCVPGDEKNLPEGWSSEILENHVDLGRGLSYKGAGLTDADDEEGIPMHNLNSVYEGGGYKYEGIKYYKGEFKDRHLVKPGDVIVTNTEQGHKYLLIGFPAIVPSFYGEKGIFSQHIYRVTPKESSSITPQFLYYLLMQKIVREQVISCTNGTTVNMLSKDGLRMPQFFLPPESIVHRFTRLVSPIIRKKEELYKEELELSKLRNTLLPKLMSGKIDV